MHYLTLRAAARLLVLMQTSLHARADETTSIITTTSVLSTQWIVISRASDTIITYTTSAAVTGLTLGVTTIVDSQVHSTQVPESSPSTETPTSSSINMVWEGQSFRDAVLNSTNQYRDLHEASSVKWNETLASYAQDLADECDFSHSEGGDYGENLAQGYTSPTLAIDGWANEESEYDYEERKFSKESGHFTQLVWKNTTAVGCGAADCDDNGWLFVCEYSPRGNMRGDFGGNVGKPGQGEDGEPGISDAAEEGEDADGDDGDDEGSEGGAAGNGVKGRLLVALVAVSVLAGLYA